MAFVRSNSRGMTLVEVLLAIAILGFGLGVLLTGASRCISVIRKARDYQTAQWVLTMGEAVHYVVPTNEVELLNVDDDRSLVEGFTFSRTAEEDDDEDGLCQVRTEVSWTERGRTIREEFLSLVYVGVEEDGKR